MDVNEALAALESCPCQEGCPGCVGAAVSRQGKLTLIQVLRELTGKAAGE